MSYINSNSRLLFVAYATLTISLSPSSFINNPLVIAQQTAGALASTLSDNSLLDQPVSTGSAVAAHVSATATSADENVINDALARLLSQTALNVLSERQQLESATEKSNKKRIINTNLNRQYSSPERDTNNQLPGSSAAAAIQHNQFPADKEEFLSKKLNKIVKELIDNELASRVFKNKEKRLPGTTSSVKQSSHKRKKWTPEYGNEEKFVIIMKEPWKVGETLESSQQEPMTVQVVIPETKSNHLNPSWEAATGGSSSNKNLFAANGLRNSAADVAKNLNDHARSILNDKFGILQESKFTTNNHLGLKGVPKFGSEEEY